MTLPGGGADKYMRFGDAYVKHHDGTLSVLRSGAKEPFRYAAHEWSDVDGDQRRMGKRGFWG